jgi:hypothetical protein
MATSRCDFNEDIQESLLSNTRRSKDGSVLFDETGCAKADSLVFRLAIIYLGDLQPSSTIKAKLSLP